MRLCVGRRLCMYQKRFHTGEVHTRFRHLRAHMSLTLDKDHQVYARLQTELRDRAVIFSSVRMSKPDVYDPSFGVQKLEAYWVSRSKIAFGHDSISAPSSFCVQLHRCSRTGA
jgi:hypothetical protein